MLMTVLFLGASLLAAIFYYAWGRSLEKVDLLKRDVSSWRDYSESLESRIDQLHEEMDKRLSAKDHECKSMGREMDLLQGRLEELQNQVPISAVCEASSAIHNAKECLLDLEAHLNDALSVLREANSPAELSRTRGLQDRGCDRAPALPDSATQSGTDNTLSVAQ